MERSQGDADRLYRNRHLYCDPLRMAIWPCGYRGSRSMTRSSLSACSPSSVWRSIFRSSWRFLTIIGYSINDTIVIFDRIRENLRFAKIKTFSDLCQSVNASVWQTMTRSINTALTVLFAAAALFIFGSESIRLFSLAMLIGLFSGAYSSIFIASPLWLLMKKKSKTKRGGCRQSGRFLTGGAFHGR